MDLDWTQESTAGVTLVRACLRNDRATDRRVRLRNRLDGPVLPPRRHGTPEAGWDRDGVTTVVPADETVSVGYACPAPTSEPPVVVAEAGAATGETSDSTAEASLRELGDHRPPRAVLGGEADDGATDEMATGVDLPTTEAIEPRDDASGRAESPGPDSLPDGTEELLDRYRTRVRTAEALNAAGVVEATALLDANDGLAGTESLASDLDADARELRALARTAATLAARAAATTPPTEALRRLS
jgi:hypothetical protein